MDVHRNKVEYWQLIKQNSVVSLSNYQQVLFPIHTKEKKIRNNHEGYSWCHLTLCMAALMWSLRERKRIPVCGSLTMC